MTITLTGDNSFLLKRELKKYKEQAVKDYGDLAMQQIDCSEAELPTILEALISLPFLSSKKLVILRQASSNKELSEQLPELITELPETTDLIIVEEQIDKRTSLYKFLKDQTEFKEFKMLDPNTLINWVVGSAKERGATISSNDARYLIERVGSNQERLDNEIGKLGLYDASITRQSIDLLTDPNPNSTIFDLLEAAFNGNSKQTLKLYDEQRQLKVEPQQIMSMLTWQLHVLFIVKAAGDKPVDNVAREAGLNPFVVRKTLNVSKDLSLGRISQLVDNLLKLDEASKSKSIDLDDGLTHYLLSI
jgi:DNA polymerase-3 subunit delta